MLEQVPDRVFAFDECGPLGLRLVIGRSPERHPATYHRTHGIRYFHG